MSGCIQEHGAGEVTHARRRGRLRRASAAVCLALLFGTVASILPSCAGKNGDAPLAPPVAEGQLLLQASVVQFRTDIPARGWIRYGFAAGRLDHAAYPAAADRGDRALEVLHRVPLLDLRVGERIYAQAVVEANGLTGTSEVQSFVSSVDSPDALFTSTMIHIGFGDCHLLTFPTTGKRLLIDSGPRSAGRAVDDYLTRKGVGEVDAMLATHVHLDHLGGMLGVGDSTSLLTAYPPEIFFDSPTKTVDKDAYDDALALLAADPTITRAVIHRFDTSATSPELAFDPAVNIRVLNSGRAADVAATGSEGTIINNESIVLRFSYGDVDFIIGGDAEDEATASILRAVPPNELEVEFYKAQHHGLPDANSAPWINALRPRVAFIPNTQQVWRPPDEFEDAISACTARLQAISAHIYAIDDIPTLNVSRGSGAQHNITFATDGVSYEVRVELAPQATFVGTEQHKCQ